MAAVLNVLKIVLQPAYSFMGTVDPVEIASGFCKIRAICDDTVDKMVHLTDCQNTQTSTTNGLHEVTSTTTTTNSCQQNSTDRSALEGVVKEADTNVVENVESKKRKIVESVTEPSNKRVKTSSPKLTLEILENTGRGKRIKKPSKRSHFYDDYADGFDHPKDSCFKRPEKRYDGDGEDKEYRPTNKAPRSLEEAAPARNFDAALCPKANGLTVPVRSTTSLAQRTDSCVSEASLGNSGVWDKKQKNVEENCDIEGLTIIDIANSSEEEDADETSSMEIRQNDLLENDSESNQGSTRPDSGANDAEPPLLHEITGGVVAVGSSEAKGGSDRPNVAKVPPLLSIAYAVAGADVIGDGRTLMASQASVLRPEGACQTAVLGYKNTNSSVKATETVRQSVPSKHKETNSVTSSKIQKKSQKKPLKKTQKKTHLPDQMFNDFELKHLGRLKSSTATKKQEKPSDGSKPTAGPYVRCKQSRSSAMHCRVVNVKDSHDADHGSSNPAKYAMVPSETCSSRATSQMSENVPWKCIFCSYGSSYMNSGDLFGPYFPQQPPTSQTPNGESAAPSPHEADSKTEKSFQQSTPHALPNGLPSEIWVHCDCAVWTNGIFVSGGRLRGLEEAALAAQHSVCCTCNQKGATLGCLVKGCELKYHYLCACQAGCTFQEENFSILCPRHKAYRISKPVSIVEPTIS